MSATPDSTLANPEQRIADLERQLAEREAELAERETQLAECKSERDEALEQQTATAEVLQVINSSPGDLAPVFDAMLEKAMRLCGAAFGFMTEIDSELSRTVAARGVPTAYAVFRERNPTPATTPIASRVRKGEPFIHIADLRAERFYEEGDPQRRAIVDLGGARTLLAVPLMRDRAALGAIQVYRTEVRRFTDKQIALLQNFAAQAVIAMENARLITETHEALEQQTATAEVLQVINSSPGNLTPVFEATLEKATRLCDAPFGVLWSFDGSLFRAAAVHGPVEFARYLRDHPQQAPPRSDLHRVMQGEDVLYRDDYGTGQSFNVPLNRAFVDLGGERSGLLVALRKDDQLLGAIRLFRQEVRPFTDQQIALLQNFAAQAVIAMENARLLTETREALDQQTATAEVLGVINASPGDLAPIFDAMVERAMRLCEADEATVRTYDGEVLQLASAHGKTEIVERLRQLGPSYVNGLYESLRRGESVINIADVRETDAFRDSPRVRERMKVQGIRSWLVVALRKDNALLGVINVIRREVRPFSDKQIGLLQNFAAQAVIAMENARLITETREALEQQTATAEVLQVINASPGELAPVFDAMLEKAMRLCEADFGAFCQFGGESFRAIATRGLPMALNELLLKGELPVHPGGIPDRLRRGERVIHIPDLTNVNGPARTPVFDAMIDRGGARSTVWVDLRKDDHPVGYFAIYRQEVRPFTEKQIALLQNFAAQAVIAMENARLLGELRERTSDLQESLEYQTATSDVLKVISRSGAELRPVLETLVETATRICLADNGLIFELRDDEYHMAASVGFSPEFNEHHLRNPTRPGRGTITGRVAIERRVVHIEDAQTDPEYSAVISQWLGQTRTMLGVPLVRGDAVAGVITLSRSRVEPFSEKQIALVTTFADQAVIAIENARLITETREALEQQTATAEVLQVISRSTFDLQGVLDTLVGTASRLCDADFGALSAREGDAYRVRATCALVSDFDRFLRGQLFTASRATITGRALLERQTVHIADASADPELAIPEAVTTGRLRTMLGVPLLREGEPLGVFVLSRERVEPFGERQIELVRTFADQAVIAIENARLLDEVQQRQAELRVTFDNMADGVAMFDAALRLTAWNRNFQELLALPEDILAEHPTFNEYIRYLTERGEFGETDAEAQIARLRARVGEHYSFERTRPDGTVIEVRHNPMPEGGFVLIYGDITARKRSEAEIRTARDAAEAAYHDLQAAQANLVQAQKMAALGQLTAGIAHEIKNPLNFVNNFASLSIELLDELKETTAPALSALDQNKRADADDTLELLTGNLEKIAEHGQRADNIVKSMLEHSRGVSGERREVDLNRLIEEALNLAYHGARAQDASFNITLERDYAPALAPIELAPQEITRVFLNLFGNGFYAAHKRASASGDAAYRPTLTVATRENGDGIEVRVKDNGTGIPPEIRDKLFQPFFTTKPTGEGTGLGLSISYDIVTQQHGGTVTVESEPGSFTEFTVRLPRH